MNNNRIYEQQKFLFVEPPAGITTDGGEGSGNWGHKGRPGHVGGSGKGGGKQHRTQGVLGNYVGYEQVKSFRRAKGLAVASKNSDEFMQKIDDDQKTRYTLCKQFCDINGYKYDADDHREDYETAEDVAYEHGDELDAYMRNWYAMMHESKPRRKGNRPVTGRDISGRFKVDESFNRRTFGAAIDQVVEAQGFNGTPKVVSAAEFDRILKQNPDMPLMMRSYNAPDEETLGAFDETLESGEWYVDCEAGGSLWGCGMYTGAVLKASDAFDKDSPQYKTLINEMLGYRGQHQSANYFGTKNVAKKHATRRMTMMPDAKIIGQRELAIMALESKTANITPDLILEQSVNETSLIGAGMQLAEKERATDGLTESDSLILGLVKGLGLPQYETHFDELDLYTKKQIAYSYKCAAYRALKRAVNESFYYDRSARTYSDLMNPQSETYKSFYDNLKGRIDISAHDHGFYGFSSSFKPDDVRTLVNMCTDQMIQAYKAENSHSDMIDTLRNGTHKEIRNVLRRMSTNQKYYPYGDQCVWAASMGYDAVNTNNHNDGTSDIIVLNRTKVILDKDYVEVENAV